MGFSRRAFLLFVIFVTGPSSIRSVFSSAADADAVENVGTCSADDETCMNAHQDSTKEDEEEVEEEEEDEATCKDENEQCEFWATEHDECTKNPACTFLFFG